MDPGEALIHVVEVSAGSGKVWIECESTHLFDKKPCLDQWLVGYNGKTGLVASVRDYNEKLGLRRSERRNVSYEGSMSG